ncbi:MAG: type II toxin-antitoxin system RelE/ParE family toxin [Alphaproteobacteria bacterium]
MRLRFSRRARLDLAEIGDFITRDSYECAAAFVRMLRERCRTLIAFPEIGPLRPDIGPGIRVLTHERYLVLYVVDADVIEVRRIVHGARDLQRLR